MNKKLDRFSPAFRHALDLVENMAQADFYLLPPEPTLVMAVVGARAGHVTRSQARNIYRAMIRSGSFR
jgi:hypothetical protein